jgi:hypothetical protein
MPKLTKEDPTFVMNNIYDEFHVKLSIVLKVEIDKKKKKKNLIT